MTCHTDWKEPMTIPIFINAKLANFEIALHFPKNEA